ncbi:alpha/beta hydrolase [Bizionia myxarmorum]|uniref:Alpha/beta hydrolase n=2 Tax=Bizionia myxarmorum TaxID=291186 RepID=A0A5D0RAC0_9FLAO|nr:alpha/beta hydrolase [Bizionia myxarmorum]
MKKPLYFVLVILVLIGLTLISMIRLDVSVEELKPQYANEYSKFMRMDGMDVHFRDEGEGIPLILIHGISSSLHTWDGWAEELQGNFRIIRLDLPGFGLTGPNANQDYSVENYVAFIKSFLDRLEIDSCYMAGSSLGGYITWNVAEAHPDLVKKMILLDAAGYPFSSETTPTIFKVAQFPMAPFLNKLTPRFVLAESVNDVYGDDTKVTDAVIDRYYNLNLREGNRDAFLDVVNNLQFVQFQKLKTIKTPTLIMWGEKDIWVAPESANRFKADLSNSELIMYSGVGHIPMEEIPEQTAADALDFLLKDLANVAADFN